MLLALYLTITRLVVVPVGNRLAFRSTHGRRTTTQRSPGLQFAWLVTMASASSLRMAQFFQSHRIPFLAASVGGAGLFLTTTSNNNTLPQCNDEVSHPPAYPWRHRGFFSSYDCAALRRGFTVYRQVCATCHSLERMRWRELVGVTHTKDEVKELAKEVDVLDGPNSDGEFFERPAKLFDRLPSPYTNIEQGRAANGGAYPPDLSLMVKARHEGHDYIMSLLTGYMEAPAGRDMMDGLYYNPYFPGGGISMPPPLQDEGVEYADGTVASISQQARDVVQFLSWTAEPEADERKKNAGLNMCVLIFMMLLSGYAKRYQWAPLKTRKISYVKGM